MDDLREYDIPYKRRAGRDGFTLKEALRDGAIGLSTEELVELTAED